MRCFAFFFVLIYSVNGYSQDSTKVDSMIINSADKFSIKNTVDINGVYEGFSYEEYIWSDRRSLPEIFQTRNNYRVYNKGNGQNNIVIFDDFNSLRYFKDGFKINSFDTELISINEVDKVQEMSIISSMLYSDYINEGAVVNIITKDVIQNEPFSQLRYTQDRYGALAADVYFSQSLSEKLNYQFGVTNSSSDGRYTNSGFSKWAGRFRLNYFINSDFNIKSNFNFATIDRGEFGGLINDSSQTVVNDTLKNYLNHLSINTGLYFKPFKNKNNLSKILFSFQRYGQDIYNPQIREHSPEYSNSYSLVLNQKINITLQSFNSSYLEFYSSIERIENQSNSYNFLNIFSRFELSNNKILLAGYINLKSNDIQNSFNSPSSGWTHKLIPGIEVDYTAYKDEIFRLKFYSGVNYVGEKNSDNSIKSNINGLIGVGINYYDLYIKLQYLSKGIINNLEYVGNLPVYENSFKKSISVKLKYKLSNIYIDIANDFYPEKDNLNLLNGNIYYGNKLFKDKLDLRAGFLVKYYKGITSFYNYQTANTIKNDVMNLDFYVGARIGSANVSFTLANLFNRFNYDTYLYPYDDRGGLLNVVSRFTIVWDFLN